MKHIIVRDIRKILEIIRKPEMSILPGNIAFYFVMSLIPMCTIIIGVASIFTISAESVIEFIRNILPAEASEFVINILSSKGFDSGVGLFNIFAVVVASNGMYAIGSASDLLYNTKKGNEIKKRIKSIIMLLIIVILFMFLIIVPIFGNQILDIMKHSDILSFVIDDIIFVFDIIKWPLTFLIIYFCIKLLYTIAPSKKILSKETTVGALLTSLLWMVVTAVFGYYLQNFANYNVIYGNLSSIIILMMWMYILAYVLVLGMAINATNYHNKNENG